MLTSLDGLEGLTSVGGYLSVRDNLALVSVAGLQSLSTLGLGTAIIAESGLSFLGFGVQPPTPTWGWTLSYGTRYMRSEPWLSIVLWQPLT